MHVPAAVENCEPALPNLPALTDTLNQTNDFSTFVREVAFVFMWQHAKAGECCFLLSQLCAENLRGPRRDRFTSLLRRWETSGETR
eukprot:6209832-Pleurochrysis_carterae.AAC.1